MLISKIAQPICEEFLHSDLGIIGLLLGMNFSISTDKTNAKAVRLWCVIVSSFHEVTQSKPRGLFYIFHEGDWPRRLTVGRAELHQSYQPSRIV